MNIKLETRDEHRSSSMGSIETALQADATQTLGTFGNLKLGTHFQPIISLAHRRIVGFEALLRATGSDGKKLDPYEAFSYASNESETVLLDRLSRAVHLRNFVRQQFEPSWLFLNVNPHVIVEGKHYGAFFKELLDHDCFPPHRIVVEILEAALVDEDRLSDAVNYYRNLGCLIAIDDFGAGHSNFDRIWRLRPDIVKFDRSIVMRAAGDRNIRAVVLGMVSLVHEAGSLVVMEGIETELEAMIAMDADADFAQGYYFARPQESIPANSNPPPALANLFRQFTRVVALERANYRSEIAPYINGLGYSSVLLKAGQPFEIASRGFLELPLAERCFLLDAHGYQIGDNISSPHLKVKNNSRYVPVSDASGANWSRRHYFRRALAQQEKLHVTRPYLSAPTATQCVTISIAIKVNGEQRVLCGDVNWSDQSCTGDRSIDTGR